MNMYDAFEELLDELYAEDYTIDEIVDALDELAVKHHNDELELENELDTVSECDGDCENCKYAYEDDSDEYEYGYHDVPQDLEDFMDGKYDDMKNDASDWCDSINHPSHYVGKIEVIDFIEDKNLNYNLGNCVKYIARAGKKHEAGMSIQEKTLEDLRKARWYLDREISTIEAEL